MRDARRTVERLSARIAAEEEQDRSREERQREGDFAEDLLRSEVNNFEK